MKWFAKWRERREMRRLRVEFADFMKNRPGWGGEHPFQFYCQLEALGAERVRAMLVRGEALDFTIH